MSLTVCYAICSLFYSAISDWSIVWGTECKNLSTTILKNLGFSAVECLYFLCFGHSYFISIDMDIPQMKSNYGFCEKNYSYRNEIHQISVWPLLPYVGLNVFYLINVFYRECTFKVIIALLTVEKVQSYVTRCARLFVLCFSAICVRQYCI